MTGFDSIARSHQAGIAVLATDEPADFHSPASFRSWLKKNHASTSALIVRLYRNHAENKGITYAQALDEALCFGWIDGVRRSFDKDSFTVRFSPRRGGSIWSLVNVGHAQRLIKDGRMAKSGLVAFQSRDEKFRSEKKAWEFFQSQAPWYRRTSAFWVMSAKREETREKRLGILIACSGRAAPIPALARPKKSGA